MQVLCCVVPYLTYTSSELLCLKTSKTEEEKYLQFSNSVSLALFAHRYVYTSTIRTHAHTCRQFYSCARFIFISGIFAAISAVIHLIFTDGRLPALVLDYKTETQ